MVSGNFDGLRALQRRLETIARNAQSLGGEHKIDANELFSPDFMRQHTKLESLAALRKDAPCEISTAADWNPPADFDSYIASQTLFSSWSDMLRAAVNAWATKRLTQST